MTATQTGTRAHATARPRPRLAWIGLCALGAMLCGAPHARADRARPFAVTLASNAPAADPGVIDMAVRALSCGRASGAAGDPATLSVIDYSRPSTEPRLWVFDLDQGRLLFEERVAHGRNSGADLATRFSNVPGSLMSSIGSFVTAETYVGRNGYSLRLHGLEPGFNDKALERAIVIHGAPYVSDSLVSRQGRLGRSFGCPAVRTAIARPLIDSIRGGSFVFAYYPDPEWLERSPLLQGCDRATTAGLAEAPRPVSTASAGPARTGAAR